MAKSNFKYDLETIYGQVNNIIKEYKNPNTTMAKRNFLIEDLLNITEELVKNNCKNFITRYTITDLTVDEIYSIAISTSLLEAIDWFTFEKGNNFMPIWKGFMERRFLNELKKISSQKASFFRTCVTSSDNIITPRIHGGESRSTIMEIVGEEDFSEGICQGYSFMEILEKFERIDKFGEVISCFLIGSQDARTRALLKVLGAESYGANERKAVQRTKERFIKFLIKNDYNLAGYDVKKFI